MGNPTSYKVTFTVSLDDKSFEIEAYAMKFVNNLPTRFQILVNGYFEGFISRGSDKWLIEKYSLSRNLLNEELVQEIGNYLSAYYS